MLFKSFIVSLVCYCLPNIFTCLYSTDKRLYPFSAWPFFTTFVCASIITEFRDNINFMLSVMVINPCSMANHE